MRPKNTTGQDLNTNHYFAFNLNFRYDRTFIKGSDADAKSNRDHLKYLSNKATSRLVEDDLLHEKKGEEQNQNLILQCLESFKTLVADVSSMAMKIKMLKSTGDLFKILATDAALVAVIPYPHLSAVTELLQASLSAGDAKVRDLSMSWTLNQSDLNKGTRRSPML